MPVYAILFAIIDRKAGTVELRTDDVNVYVSLRDALWQLGEWKHITEQKENMIDGWTLSRDNATLTIKLVEGY